MAASRGRSRAMDAALRALESVTAQDPGKRGVGHLFLPGAFVGAACVLAASKHPLVLTGFPCRLADDPPTENDGPAGAAAIVRLCARLGKSVTVATDACNEDVVSKVVQLAWEQGHADSLAAGRGEASGSALTMRAVAAAAAGDEADAARALRESRAVAAGCDAAIAIERAGRAADGSYRTMRGLRMDHIVAPLGAAAEAVAAARDGSAGPLSCRVVGVGDGGNEMGMGAVVDQVRAHIALGETVACVEECDFLVAAGVSNWGGWALCAGAEALFRELARDESAYAAADAAAAEAGMSADAAAAAVPAAPATPGRPGLALSPDEAIAAVCTSEEAARCAGLVAGSAPGVLVPSEAEEVAVMAAAAAAGARDGITGDQSGTMCDGMAWSEHAAVLHRLRALGAPV
ncbi:hypothetical protein FNF31_02401 [Cafeteria roenbergensis]|uniref:D-glutamate cyclase-like C-terminal domain-containing protein n=1 Tax=Cafeteria roenbergensis TaxID=33653 RepID=A0A5A8DIN1_CAFRO|nr:hypothetical protein FNF31_02401 [Cafeteria roenbergensis]KAA0170046.1 hypothetical protein FNF28_01655 [Cafeteria roenbergensis]